MFNITWKYLNSFNNKPPGSWVAHITRDFVTCYYCPYYSSMVSVTIWGNSVKFINKWFFRKTVSNLTNGKEVYSRLQMQQIFLDAGLQQWEYCLVPFFVFFCSSNSFSHIFKHVLWNVYESEFFEFAKLRNFPPSCLTFLMCLRTYVPYSRVLSTCLPRLLHADFMSYLCALKSF